GTNDPSVSLHVGVSDPQIRFHALVNGRYINIIPGAGSLDFYHLNGNGSSWTGVGHINRYVSTSLSLVSGGGRVGVGLTPNVVPSASLHISGTLRLSGEGWSCDSDRAGAIRYVGGDFQVCYGTGGWA